VTVDHPNDAVEHLAFSHTIALPDDLADPLCKFRRAVLSGSRGLVWPCLRPHAADPKVGRGRRTTIHDVIKYANYDGPQGAFALLDGAFVPLDHHAAERLAINAHLLSLGDPTFAQGQLAPRAPLQRATRSPRRLMRGRP
jgi:hypothetical protein